MVRFNHLILSIFFGTIFFFIITSGSILNPTNYVWLGFEIDPFQHQIGWMFYRISQWNFPIGLSPLYGMSISSSIVYSDSIPLFAILFKLISGLIPTNFQYFGIWTLMIFIFQSYYSVKIISIFTKDRVIPYLALPLLIFLPFLLNRIGFQSALSSHFLLLIAIYFTLKKVVDFRFFKWLLLILTSSLIHFYILAMILGLWIANTIDLVLNKSLILPKELINTLITIVLLLLTMWIVGYFTVGVGSVADVGFGAGGMDVLSFFNSKGWSWLLPSIPSITSYNDWFQYPGAGIFAIFVFAIFKIKHYIDSVYREFLKQPFLCLLLFFFTLFAISNYIKVGSFSIEIPIHNKINSVLSVFRTSDRFFWPVVYFFIFFNLIFIIRHYSKFYAIGIILVSSIIQITDTYQGWEKISLRLSQNTQFSDAVKLKSSFWKEAASYYSNVITIPFKIPVPDHWQTFSHFANVNHIGVTSAYLARVDQNKVTDLINSLDNGEINPYTLYIIDKDHLLPLLKNFNSKRDLLTNIDGHYLLAPNWKQCGQCNQSYKSISTNNFLGSPNIDSKFIFSNSGAFDRRFLINGWSKYQEDWGVWSEGNRSNLLLPIPKHLDENLISIHLRAYINNNSYQTLKISTNGIFIGVFYLHSFENNLVQFSLPELSKEQGYVFIELNYSEPISPKEIGLGDDSRKIAVGLKSIEFK